MGRREHLRPARPPGGTPPVSPGGPFRPPPPARRRGPAPHRLFALGIDRPLYYSVPSAYAQLTPSGGALIHVAKYGGDSSAEPELEGLLDEMQPGWRDVVVHRRFLPAMVVSNAIAEPP